MSCLKFRQSLALEGLLTRMAVGFGALNALMRGWGWVNVGTPVASYSECDRTGRRVEAKRSVERPLERRLLSGSEA